MKKYNVLYIAHSVHLGGATQSLIDMVESMQKYINPYVIFPEKGEVLAILREMGIVCDVVPLSDDYGDIDENIWYKQQIHLFDDYCAAKEIHKYIEKWKIDIVHINSSVGNAGAIAAIMDNIPIIWHIRELIEEQYDKNFYDLNLKLDFLKCAEKRISISDFVKETYIDKYGLSSERIYNGLNLLRYKDVIREYYDKSFIYVGNINRNKGIEDVIAAVKIVHDSGYQDLVLHVYGKGDACYLDELYTYIKKENIEHNVFFHEFTNDLSKIRRKISFSITASKMEALGRVTIEAMLAGNMVIGANEGGTKEIIGANNERGLLFERGNAYELAETMIKAITMNDQEKKRITENAQEYVNRLFDSREYANALIRIYDSVIFSYKPGRGDMLLKLVQKRLAQSKWNLFSVRSAEELVDKYHVRKCIIWGMGKAGSRLIAELDNKKIRDRYIYDKNDNVSIDDNEIRVSLEDLVRLAQDKERFLIITMQNENDIASVISILKDKVDNRIFRYIQVNSV